MGYDERSNIRVIAENLSLDRVKNKKRSCEDNSKNFDWWGTAVVVWCFISYSVPFGCF